MNSTFSALWLQLQRLFLQRHLPATHRSHPQLRQLFTQCQGLDIRKLCKQTISESRFVVLDTETTGFHAYAGDEMVSIAMLEYRGLEATGNNFLSLINPQRSIPSQSTSIHGIRDEDVVNAPVLDEIIQELIEFIGDAVIIGHHISFDLRFINKALRQKAGCKLRNPWLDTMLLYLGHTGRLGHYSLEEVAEFCRISIKNRHSAEGDAHMTAAIFIHLLPLLADPQDNIKYIINQQFSADY